MKQKVEIEVEIPEGYEPTGEFRKVSGMDWYLDRHGHPWRWEVPGESGGQYIIIRKRKVEPEQPQYKAFLIDWDTNEYPSLRSGYPADIGTRTNGYRIFGYGNRPEFSESVYSPWPCTPCGNHKYAYGRLEK